LLKSLAKIIRWTAMALVAGFILLLAVNNREPVKLSLFPLPFEATMPLFLIVILFFLTGLFAGGVAMSVKSLRLSRMLKKQRNRNNAVENELLGLRAEKERREDAALISSS
jgi:uncharacterized integral membrane protein